MNRLMRSLLAFIAVLLLFNSCAQKAAQPSSAPLVLAPESLPVAEWWEMSGDPELKRLVEARLDLSLAVARAYFEVQADLVKRGLLQKIYNQRSALLKLTDVGQTEGCITEIGLLLMAQEMVDIEKQLADLEQKIATGKRELAVLTRQDACNPSPFKPFPIPKKITVDLLVRRSDLKAHIERALSATQEGKTQFYPDVDLMALGACEGLCLKQLLAASAPASSLPLFAAGHLNLEAVYEYNELLLRAAIEAAGHLSRLCSLNEKIRIQTQFLDAARGQYTLEFFHFTEKGCGYPRVLRAEQAVLGQQLIDAELQHERLMATLDLIEALGGGY
jgi:outer membrane protein TolC